MGYRERLRTERARREFRTIQRRLAVKLEHTRITNHEGEKFYPNRAPRDVFLAEKADVGGLYRMIARYANVQEQAIVEQETQIFVERATGAHGHRSGDYISEIVGLLVCSHADLGELAWTRVASSINSRRWPAALPLTDINLFDSASKPGKLFEKEATKQRFLNVLNEFKVVVLHRGECRDYTRVENSSSSHWYFLYEHVRSIGGGVHGTVNEVKISRNHIETRDQRSHNQPSCNPDAEVYAVKELLPSAVNSSTRLPNEWDFHNLIQQVPQNSASMYIVYAAAALRFRDKISIFMDLADCNLRQFMDGTEPRTEPLEDLQQIRDVADAVDYIHNKIVRSDRHVVCCHLDIKLENILVFKLISDAGGYRERYGPRQADYILKLADFGMSKLLPSNTVGNSTTDATQYYRDGHEPDHKQRRSASR